MFKNIFKFSIVFVLITLISCAKRGTITGGSKDTLAPVLTASFPKNYSTNFNGKEIKLNFDEYVILKDVSKQLVVSPPMNNAPDIQPQAASKHITIKIKDTLKPNTTYSFNFGQSIKDNNEGNAYPQFKYVFSTGSQIDSLTVEGSVQDALLKKTDTYVSVMLYEMDEKYNDSVIFKQKPRYITNTLESGNNFKIENIKAGKYKLIAVKDANGNFKFDPKSDKIGFYNEPITVPTTAKYPIKIFKQKAEFKTLKPSLLSDNRAILGYEGKAKNLKVTLKNGDVVIPSVLTKMEKKDSVQIWFPKTKADSLSLTVNQDNFSKNYYLKLKEMKKADTLSLAASTNGILLLRENFFISANTPIKKFDKAKMVLKNKDSVAVPFTVNYDELNQNLNFVFKKEPSEKYILKIAPGAITDFFDTSIKKELKYKFDTQSSSEYGNLTVKLENTKEFPVIIELTDEKGEVKATAYSEKNPVIVFDNLKPAKYNLRVIYDSNKNGEWDPGDYMEKRQAEQVIYFPKELDVRANWDVEQPFDLKE